MSLLPARGIYLVIFLCLLGSCAQIVPPQGGPRDVRPPVLLAVSPDDSLFNTRVNKIDLRFDEFVTFSNPAAEVTISPILPFPPDITVNRRTVTVKIPDSLLKDNTTYRISFGNAIQDIHENNPFTGYSYIFSTGSYFDSLRLSGFLINAETGLKDSSALVVLYDASRSDSAVVREKPLYAVKADNAGGFLFQGLPGRAFRLFAIRDANNNMIYDGPGEMVAFHDSLVYPSRSTAKPIRLRLFAEPDTAAQPTQPTRQADGKRSRLPGSGSQAPVAGFSYSVAADTSDPGRRTRDITSPLEILFTQPITNVNINRVNLSYDSAGTTIESVLSPVTDTSKPQLLALSTNWKENTLYTLRLLKGFAQDTAGNDAMPGRYTFRTKRDEDYGKLLVHLPAAWQGNQYLFVLLRDQDTVYQRPVRDTMIRFTRLQPGTYALRVIADVNENGHWDPGNVLARKQPEEVFPHSQPVTLKPGWENMIDFEVPKVGNQREGSIPR